MVTPLQHFWTAKGVFDARDLREDRYDCRKVAPDQHQRQMGDKGHFGNITSLLGATLDQRALGDLHIWRGDCTHWIMPGMTDVLAAEFGELVQNMTARTTLLPQ